MSQCNFNVRVKHQPKPKWKWDNQNTKHKCHRTFVEFVKDKNVQVYWGYGMYLIIKKAMRTTDNFFNKTQCWMKSFNQCLNCHSFLFCTKVCFRIPFHWQVHTESAFEVDYPTVAVCGVVGCSCRRDGITLVLSY